VSALGVDALAPGTCPPDYSGAEIGVVLSGNDVYARRNVYVFDVLDGGTTPSVVSVTPAGCRIGAPANAAALRHELETAKVLE
jgi:hypothetical protein